uniref:HMA domain-containing protein n=1 Tax=Cajanus cajan TaxID=3821 RepID=A0A151U1L3_CAJCA|nr:hypothetical protein KK1_005721 [Cajanus cajan]
MANVVEVKVGLHCDECIKKIFKAIKKIEECIGEVNYGDVEGRQNRRRRLGIGDLGSSRGASSRGTRERSERDPTIVGKNPPPYDMPAARTLERSDSRRMKRK